MYQSNKMILIAEIGVNHNGDINLAYKLIDEAVKYGFDIVKFQTFNNKLLLEKDTSKAVYQKKDDNDNQTFNDLIKNLELTKEEFRQIKNYCCLKSIKFLSTPFDNESVDLLDDIGVDMFKISSGDLTNYPLLFHISKKGKPVILSTGLSTEDEIKNSIDFLRKNNCDNITLMHCVSSYPTPAEDYNIKSIQYLRDKFGLSVGLSDHSLGYQCPVLALVLGASYLEKHITLDKNMEGPDHKASLDPEDMKILTEKLNETYKLLGKYEKVPREAELINKYIIRRSLAVNRDFKAGDILNETNLIALRPLSGIPAENYESIIGKKLKRDKKIYEVIKFDDIE
jgi:N,N'-diacetyllegionaminate synthase